MCKQNEIEKVCKSTQDTINDSGIGRCYVNQNKTFLVTQFTLGPAHFWSAAVFLPTVLEIVKYLSMVSGHSSLCKSLPVCVSTQL